MFRVLSPSLSRDFGVSAGIAPLWYLCRYCVGVCVLIVIINTSLIYSYHL